MNILERKIAAMRPTQDPECTLCEGRFEFLRWVGPWISPTPTLNLCWRCLNLPVMHDYAPSEILVRYILNDSTIRITGPLVDGMLSDIVSKVDKKHYLVWHPIWRVDNEPVIQRQ